MTFADGHKSYVHSKENIRETDGAWENVWRDFENQFGGSAFRRGVDRLLLHTGEIRKEHLVLREMCKRAADAQSTEEWVNSLSQEQGNLLRKIQSCLSEPHAKWGGGIRTGSISFRTAAIRSSGCTGFTSPFLTNLPPRVALFNPNAASIRDLVVGFHSD